MNLEIAVATLVALGYALGAYADEKRERRKVVGRRAAPAVPTSDSRGVRPPLPSSP